MHRLKQYKHEIGLVLNDTYMENFNEQDCELVKKIYAEASSYNYGDWDRLMREHKGNRVIQSAIAGNPHLNSDMIYRLLNVGRTYKETTEVLLSRNDIDKATAKLLLSKTTDRTISDILYANSGDNKNLLNQQTLDIICEKFIDNAKAYGEEYEPIESELLTLELSSNNEMLNKILDMPSLNELVITAIAKNVRIDQTIRDKAFDMGCDYTQMTFPTPHMMVEIYKSLTDGMDVIDSIPFGANKWAVESQYSNSLITLFCRPNIPEVIEIDMFSRLIESKTTPGGILGRAFDEILEYTPNNPTAKFVYEKLKGTDSATHWNHRILKNKKISDSVKYMIINDDIDKLYDKKTSTNEKAMICDFLSMHISELKISEDQAERLIDYCKPKKTYAAKNVMMSLATSPYVTDKQLDEITKFFGMVNMTLKNPYVSELHKYCRESGLSTDLSSRLCHRYRNGYYPYDIPVNTLNDIIEILNKYKETHPTEYPFESILGSLQSQIEREEYKASERYDLFMELKKKEPDIRHQYQFYLESDAIIELIEQREKCTKSEKDETSHSEVETR